MSKQSLRIAICSSGAGHIFRGIEKWSCDMSDLLRKKGIWHRLFVGEGSGRQPYERVLRCLKRTSLFNKLLVKIFRQFGGWRYGFSDENEIEEISFVLPLVLELNRNGFDIVHTQQYGVAVCLNWLQKRGFLAPKVILGHGTNETNEALMKLDYVQHLSPVELLKRKSEGCFRPGWTAIPNFVDTDLFKPATTAEQLSLKEKRGIPSNKLVILTVSAIKKDHKRLDWLIEEMAMLKARFRDFFWIVAGGKEKETPELVELGLKRLGDNVMFLVDVNPTVMPDLYKCSDFFVLGSLREMCPIALMEAISSGLVPFLHNHPVLKYIGGNGAIIVDLAKHGLLSEAIVQNTNNSEKVITHRMLSRIQAEKMFSYDAVFEKISDYYLRVAGFNFLEKTKS